jgi:uncharacterized membrane protein YoaK (UPF0700 family)
LWLKCPRADICARCGRTRGYRIVIPDRSDSDSAREPQPAAAWLLATLACVAGYVDAVTYLALGHAFTANMTGNTVLLGISLAQSDGAKVARSLCALAGFCAGAALAARFLRPTPSGAWPAHARWGLLLESIALIALASVGSVVGITARVNIALIALSGLAMGVQSAVVWLARTSGTATTYITGTLTGTIVRAVGTEDRGEGEPRRVTLAAWIWASYLCAALLGALAAGAWHSSAMWPAAAGPIATAGLVRERPAS